MRTHLPAGETVNGISATVATRKRDDDTIEAACSCGFRSRGWTTKKLADARLGEHLEEHASGDATPELVDFLTRHDLTGSRADADPFAED